MCETSPDECSTVLRQSSMFARRPRHILTCDLKLRIGPTARSKVGLCEFMQLSEDIH